ncbi:CbiX/SirB N-terminal domain-containing protein [Desulfuromonas carbonis]|uniref:sirohydrochlorin chelatase n=1 Tax=Desulfuromonas sp. DDH964 TaxID=1823759 RepID=UPI00078CE2D3|nr:CbiX/SirB N-terminal domain-containing protein [Desulfuromonas sp. DDH964]AMV73408.1 sirohydrochlorin cobaltochelatase [Desulfuromonas sp. DDH964]
MKTAILLMGHGSRVADANDALHAIAAMVRENSGFEIVEVSFREMHAPNIQAGIDRCVAQGAGRILLYPYFLFAGAHVLEDLPAEMAAAAARYPGLEMTLGKPLGVHPKLAEIVCERVAESLEEAGWLPVGS